MYHTCLRGLIIGLLFVTTTSYAKAAQDEASLIRKIIWKQLGGLQKINTVAIQFVLDLLRLEFVRFVLFFSLLDSCRS